MPDQFPKPFVRSPLRFPGPPLKSAETATPEAKTVPVAAPRPLEAKTTSPQSPLPPKRPGFGLFPPGSPHLPKPSLEAKADAQTAPSTATEPKAVASVETDTKPRRYIRDTPERELKRVLRQFARLNDLDALVTAVDDVHVSHGILHGKAAFGEGGTVYLSVAYTGPFNEPSKLMVDRVKGAGAIAPGVKLEVKEYSMTERSFGQSPDVAQKPSAPEQAPHSVPSVDLANAPALVLRALEPHTGKGKQIDEIPSFVVDSMERLGQADGNVTRIRAYSADSGAGQSTFTVDVDQHQGDAKAITIDFHDLDIQAKWSAGQAWDLAEVQVPAPARGMEPVSAEESAAIRKSVQEAGTEQRVRRSMSDALGQQGRKPAAMKLRM